MTEGHLSFKFFVYATETPIIFVEKYESCAMRKLVYLAHLSQRLIDELI